MGGCVSFQLSCDQALIQAYGCLFGDGNYTHKMESTLEALESNMQQLKERRDDLSRKVSIEEDKGLQQLAQVQGWLSRVQGIESQVNDLLKIKSTETQRLCMFGYCSNNCKSSCDYGKEVSKKLKEVHELLSKEDFKVLAEKSLLPKVGKQHIQTTIGLDLMVQNAWNSLKNFKGTTLGLYGMGGVGKTTLLAHINNKFDEEVNESDVVIWVVVSNDLQIKSIQNQILGRLRVDKDWKQETEEEKAISIKNILSKKKFVLLLDDLWSEVDLNKIGVPPPSRESGSKIVFTTRSKEICRAMKADVEMKVDCLLPDEAWELFQRIVGEIPLKCHDDIPILARQVAEKCCGLPLALTVIGKAMACKEDVHEWNHALDVLNSSSHEFPDMKDKILSVLKFSYDSLEDENIKYCSLFPEDYEIKKEELIEYWIGEGLINGKRDEDGSCSQGHVIIGSLVRAHLLMETEIKMDAYGEFTEKMKMHDVVREMAIWIASDFVKPGAHLRHIPNNIQWEVVRRISLMGNQIEEISCCPNCPNLSTLLFGDNNLKNISGEFFKFMHALVVLNLSYNPLRGLPEEISTLSSLKYLNLSSTQIWSLPIGLKGLKKLISLDLEGTYDLRSIAGIGTILPNLQVLKLYDSGVCIDARSMEELQLLEHLEILTANVDNALSLERIQAVKRLSKCIRVLCLKNMLEEVVVLNTGALSGLQRLVILDCKISKIKIDGERSKEREELQGFKHLSTVQINHLDGPKDLTWLLFTPNLRALTAWGSRSLKAIINRRKAVRIRNMRRYIDVSFSKLESLDLQDFPKLKRI